MKVKIIRDLIAMTFVMIFTMIPAFSVMAEEVQSEQPEEAFVIDSLIEMDNNEFVVYNTSLNKTYGPGGRHDITLGDNHDTIYILVQFTHTTRVQFWDKNWKSISSKNYKSGNAHTLTCPSNVCYVTYYLDDTKVAFSSR